MFTNSAKRFKISAKSLFLIFLVLALLIFIYSIIQINQGEKEITTLMEDQAHSLLETTLASSKSALISYEIIDNEMKRRLLNNAALIKMLLEKKQISNARLEKIAEENEIHRINIFNRKGEKIFTNHQTIHTDLEETFSPKDILLPIFEGYADTLFLGVKEARFEKGYRFGLAIASKNRSAIVLNLDAKELLEFRRNIGFGALLKSVTENESIIYAVLQDTTGIIAASGTFNELSSINGDEFLQQSFYTSLFKSRLSTSDSTEVFEAVHPLVYNDRIIGLLRLGLSAEPLVNVTKRNEVRIIIMGIVLFLLGSVLLTYVFTKQNFDILKKNFEVIEDYSEKVIKNVSDCVIVLDNKGKIRTFNVAAEKLFKRSEEAVIGNTIFTLFDNNTSHMILSNRVFYKSIECKINSTKKYLLISKNSFQDKDDNNNDILVIRDLTRLRQIEDQMNRKERLVAMGEMASGVAHEIRNPLNTISTITQQLGKDFKPIDNSDEYYQLTKLVYQEIKRINKTVHDFLRFSRPEKIVLSEFKLSDLTTQLENQYSNMVSEKSAELNILLEWDGVVKWDKNQIQQALMNLIQNSIDAISAGGKISISVKLDIDQILIIVEDDGHGIPPNVSNRIFNLYFTTKASGTGIGLSVVQRIVYEHNGTIDIESEENKGTVFTIIIPINPNLIQTLT